MPTAQSSVQTFTNPDGRFHFQYPRLLVLCTKQVNDADSSVSWAPKESCISYSPVCDDPGATIVCLAYPKSAFKNYPTFEAATFSVAELRAVGTEKSCLDGSQDWANIMREKAKPVTINGIVFESFKLSEGGMGHGLSIEVYRNFHQGQCYQLSISVASHSAAVYDPPVKDVPSNMWDEVDAQLRLCLNSFQFLK
jgi:hypothetical protein